MDLTLTSFGKRNGMPEGAEPDRLFDVTALPDPCLMPSLRTLSGMDQPVQEFVATRRGYNHLEDRVERTVKEKGEAFVCCQGGRQRSVAICELVRGRLMAEGHDVTVRHRVL